MMEDPKHTKGPWEIRNPGPYAPCSAKTFIEADDEVVCSIQYGLSSRSQANAQLISAAPDLFHALEGLVYWECREGGIDDSWWEAAREAYVKAGGVL